MFPLFEPFRAVIRASVCRWPSVIAALALAALGHPGAGEAANSDYPTWSINGFGTLGAVHSTDDQADFVSNPAQPKGAGYTAAWTGTPDSKLGIQLNVDFTQRLSAVVQLLSQYQYDGTFRPDLQAFFGGFDTRLPDQGSYSAHGMRGVSDTVDYDFATLHSSYESLRYDLDFEGPPLSQVSQSILSVGASYDPRQVVCIR
jgi:hypothetical protein